MTNKNTPPPCSSAEKPGYWIAGNQSEMEKQLNNIERRCGFLTILNPNLYMIFPI